MILYYSIWFENTERGGRIPPISSAMKIGELKLNNGEPE